MSTIEWIKEISNKVNERHPDVKIWYETEVHNGQPKKSLKIRYQVDDIDYLIILDEGNDVFYFTTAYPVFEYREKKDLDKGFAKNRI